MITCFVCKNDISTNKKVFFRHLKMQHGINDRNARYSCCQGQCCRTFSSKYVFSRHLATFHSNDISEHVDTEVEAVPSAVIDSSIDQPVSNSLPTATPCNQLADETNISDLACKFVCYAKSRCTSLENVNSMVHACSEIVCTVVDNLFHTFECLKSSPSSQNAWKQMEQKFAEFRDPFAGLKTSYQQTAYVKQMGVYVPPVEYAIAKSQTFVNDRMANFCKPSLHQLTGQYIPIRDMLKTLNDHSDLVKLATAVLPANQDELRSYFDGKHWSEHPLNNQPVIVLRMYGDDFEPANPLGSHKCLYKLGCIYYQFENLPQHMLSKTENIFLALCCHSEDVKNFKWQTVFKPLVEELADLEINGIDLVINGVLCNYKVILSCVTGDNLFLNGLLGFVESFSAGHPCRQCSDHKNDFRHIFVENSATVRTIETYERGVEEQNVRDTGIKDDCCLNGLKYFHASTNCVQDVMHDMLEGVCSYDVVLICRQLVKDGTFTLADLNSAMQSLNYGYHDMSSKPPTISSLDNEMLSFEASEMWAFVRYLPAAVGHLVAADNKIWCFYLQLRKLLDIIFAPTILKTETELLSVLICEYLEMRANLFPNDNIKNKHHHMIHYPRLIRTMGPLCNLWSMRFEQKHQRYKRLMHISGNFKNVPKTVTTRHQHDVAARLMLNQTEAEEVETGVGEVVTLNELENGEFIDNVLGGGCLFVEFYKCDAVTIKGTLYKSGCCLLSGTSEDEMTPQFVRVFEILGRNRTDVIFICEMFMVEGFDEHFHAWSVVHSTPRKYVQINPKALTYYLPHALNFVQCDGMEKALLSLRYRA